jgi:hypothetical protein
LKEKYLFQAPHWTIEKPTNLEAFFGALQRLVPEETVMCFGGGDPDEAIQSFFHEMALPNPERISLIEFALGKYLNTDKKNLKKLQRLAGCHAAPEIAAHIVICDGNRRILEWFDVPFDPITISLEVPEDKVRQFCNEFGVMYQKVDARL